MYRYPQGKI